MFDTLASFISIGKRQVLFVLDRLKMAQGLSIESATTNEETDQAAANFHSEFNSIPGLKEQKKVIPTAQNTQ